MSGGHDVAARLAEGHAALDAVQTHVSACRRLGYHDPELTGYGGQVRDWYASEDGLDLRALDADCAALQSAAATAAEVLTEQESQLARVATAWQGAGGTACRELLRRHGEASARAVAAVRGSADALMALRDTLWKLVDDKVAVTVALDGPAGRADWLAAARAVTTGVGDQSGASELVDLEVKPFVDNDVRCDWLTAMSQALASITEAFHAATADVTTEPAGFTMPEGQWSAATPAVGAGYGPPVPPTASAAVPGAGGGPPAVSPVTDTVPAAAAAPPAPPEPAIAPASPAPASALPASGLGGALPGVGGGLSTFGQQLADLIGGLLGSDADALTDSSDGGGLGDSALIDEEPADDIDEEDAEEETTEAAGEDDTEEDTDDADPEVAPDDSGSDEEVLTVDEPAPATPPAPEAASTPAPPPASTPIPPPASGLTVHPESAAPGTDPPQTPCEIAADELPQVGQ